MAARPWSTHSVWTKDETKLLVQWLENPENLRKIRKGSGISKNMILTEIAARIPTKPIVKIGYMYDNLMKSYKAAVKMNNQSGWGLTQGDLDEGRRTLQEINEQDEMEEILGTKRGGKREEEGEFGLLDRGLEDMSREELDDYAQDISKKREEGRYRRNVRRGGDGEVEKEGDYRRRLEERRRVVSEKVIEGGGGMEGRSGTESRREMEIDVDGDKEVAEDVAPALELQVLSDIGILEDEITDMIPIKRSCNLKNYNKQILNIPLPISTAIRGSVKHQFPTMVEDDDENADGGTAKAEGEEKRFGFLEQQLQKQADLRYRELELEREKFEIERERNCADQRRSELMMLQMQASLQAVICSQRERHDPHSNEEENENITGVEHSFNLSNLSK
ncbi:hypothetical protein HOY82DRAFT_538015 [Tuber indicum]|nr:hypothetical protein HOY82DRAFT_538015 [Tuber indicum]